MLARYPNYVIDTAARVPEFGRHAAARMRRFFIEFQDRVLFGSDLGVGPDGLDARAPRASARARATRAACSSRATGQYFETTAREAWPNPTPIQGRWTVEAVGLPRAVLEKLYQRNAARVFGLSYPGTMP